MAMVKTLLLVMLFFPASAQAGASRLDSNADEIRSTFMFHIANFTKFPDQILISQKLTFCFMEDESSVIHKEFSVANIVRLQNLEVVGRKVTEVSDLQRISCQLLFVSAAKESPEVFAMLEALNNRTVSIGETRNFLKKGGLISLEEQQSKIQIMINQALYANSLMKFRSPLLKHAKFR
jgi:hypothetical protein